MQPDCQPSDEELIRQVAAGRAAALRALVERHQDGVRRLAWHMLRDPHAADDVAQEVFLRVHRAAGRYRARGRFKGWLSRIAVNLCRDRMRRAKRRPVSLEVVGARPAAAEGGDPMERAETVARVRRAVDALPERQRTALVLHRYQQLAHEEIAAATGWSRSAVESLLVRAYARLRETLADLKAP